MVYYQQYRPSARLSAQVECYWVLRSPTPLGEEQLIPGGRVEMVFHFGSKYRWLMRPDAPEGKLFDSVCFMGQRDRIHTGCSYGNLDILGVRFRPGGLAAFTAIPISELLNLMIPATEIMGPQVREWEDRLYECDTDRQKIALLEQLLLEKAGNAQPAAPILQPAIDLIRKDPDSQILDRICTETGWHYKKLERTFARTIGYMPKQYARIVRFNKALRQIDALAHPMATTAPSPMERLSASSLRSAPCSPTERRSVSSHQPTSLTSIGYDCGYFDQSHFIRDFARFAGTTPGNFAPREQTMTAFLLRNQPV